LRLKLFLRKTVFNYKKTMNKDFGKLMLDWYLIHARPLPWRLDPRPYTIWVSEIMLQQTRVETVIPYYERWMKKFPNLQSLAEADEQDVLSAWEGLGYYARARNMLKTARIICGQYGGAFPKEAVTLKKLPGIGKYTAAAISSIAFGLDEAVLDGNVKRVLARVHGFKEAVNSVEGEKKLWRLAADCLPKGHASDYNQSVMDLGAIICIPSSPRCGECPAAKICVANIIGMQSQLPVVLERKPVPHINVSAAIISREGRVLIARRPANGLLGGLWEFPGGKVEEDESNEHALVREIREELGSEISPLHLFGTYKHAYTHFRVTLQAWKSELLNGEPVAKEASEIRWVQINELADFPMGKIDRMISRDLTKSN
jgi:A/G-specific adenine glycosylase